MPSVKLSAGFSEIKGVQNGSIWALNQGGQYFRTRISGPRKSTSHWDKAKARLAYVSQLWRTLSTEQQNAWDAITGSWPTVNKFGETRYPSGYELFCRLNMSLKAYSQSVITTAPSPEGITDYGPITLATSEASGFVVDVTTPGTAGENIGIFASPPFSPGVTRIPARKVMLTRRNASSGFPYNIRSLWEQQFGALQNGQKVFVSCEILDISTGQTGNLYTSSIIVSGLT